MEREELREYLWKCHSDPKLISRAIDHLEKVAGDTSKSLYDRNRAVYDLLRYGVKVRPDVGENTVTVWLIDWAQPLKNHFAIAEEVTVAGADAKAAAKRPDIVLYVNGIALGVLELKRSTVSVGAGIRHNLDNQKKEFIQPFFSTMRPRDPILNFPLPIRCVDSGLNGKLTPQRTMGILFPGNWEIQFIFVKVLLLQK